jgi:hypothetical protein
VTSAVSFKESQNDNLAAELTNGIVYVGWGGYGSQWTPTASGMSSYAIANNAIAAVFGGQLDVMVGAPVNNHWNAALSGAQNVELSADGNIGAEDINGGFDVAWGGYGSQWTSPPVATNYVQAEVSDNQVGAIFGTVLDVKEGTALGGWSQVADNAVQFAIS